MIYLPIEKDFLPERFEIQLAEEIFTMEIAYNETYDFFTADIYDNELQPIVLGEKLMLNQPLFSDINDDRLPAPTIIPADSSGKETRVTFDNFMVTVFLTIDAEEEGTVENGSA